MGNDSEPLALPTRVGRAVWGGNDFFGFRVEKELTDEDAFWRGLLLSVGAGPESFVHLSVIRGLAGCNLVADPRIWPLKLTRVVASYGNVLPALSAGNVFLDGARVGPLTGLYAAEFLAKMAGIWDGREDGGPLESELVRLVKSKERLPGFGVPLRSFDERLGLVERVVEREHRDNGRHWRCSKTIEAILSKHHPLPRNTACAVSAVLLDCGFTPRQNALLQLQHCIPAYLANAVEGAAQAPEILRNLPLSAVEYVGPPPRISPAMAASLPPSEPHGGEPPALGS